MIKKEEHDRALANLRSGIDISVSLPDRVLAAEYTSMYAMDYNRLLNSLTVDIFKLLMQSDNSTVVAMANFKEVAKEFQSWNDVFIVDLGSTADEYVAFIKRNSVEFAKAQETPAMRAPWLIFAEKIGACSDVGSWCIYGEKFSEIAILGCKNRLSLSMEAKLLEFGIEQLVDAISRDSFYGEAGNDCSDKKRALLRSAYLGQ